MAYSTQAKYRGTLGTLSISSDNVIFSRVDGLFSKTERIVIRIPFNGILSMDVQSGFFDKKLILIVDNRIIRGIPRHEFIVNDPYHIMQQIQNGIDNQIVKENQPHKEILTREVTTIVKIPCPYCGSLNEVTEKKCSNCGANIGGN